MAAAIAKDRRGKKYDQVLSGARRVFMADGFEGASVDAISKEAGVSKATLYSYFADKRRLFTEVACAECRQQADRAVAEIDLSAPVEQVLRSAAKHTVGFLVSDFAQSIYRVCVAEAARFPELGAEFYDSGPKVVLDVLAPFLDMATDRGELVVHDTKLAAFQFSALCKAEVFDKSVFGVQRDFSQKELDAVIDGAVDMFMARYGVRN